MRKFIFKILLFILPLVVFILPLDYCISYFLSKSNQFPGEFEVMNDIYNSKANCEVAIYGSSRAWVHIDPAIISDSLNLTAYNFGIDGHNFWLQYLRHLELLKHNNKPKKIILAVDLYSLQKRDDLYESDQFLPYMLWNKNIKKYTSSYKGYTKYDYDIPLIRYAGKFQALKGSIKMLLTGSSNKTYRNKGYLGMDLKWNSDFDTAKAKMESYEVKLHQQSIQLFESFIQECKREKIDLILVYTPEYIEGQNFVSNRKEIIQIYEDLSTKYSLTFYDYSTDEICLDKNLFYNASHLNKFGAELFTRKLAIEIKERENNISNYKK
jgi:hypothetical protein